MAWLEVNNNQVNCLNETDNQNAEVILDWTRSGNVSQVIDVWLFPTLLLNFININVTHYKWCGPLLKIVEYFGRFYQTR